MTTYIAESLSSDSLSVLQISDLHILADPEGTLLGIKTAYYFEAILSLAFAEYECIDIILLTGDLAQDASAESYRYILRKIEKYGVPCICLPGNHDDVSVMQAALNSECINCNKQILMKDWQIISLNSQIIGSEKGYLEGTELDFLTHCLAQYPDKLTLIAVHHHCLPTDSHWMDTMMIDNSAEFLDIITRHPQVKLVLNGHIHQEQDKSIKHIRVLGAPSTCFQFEPESQGFGLDDKSPGYRWINLTSNGTIATTVHRLPEKLTELEKDTEGY